MKTILITGGAGFVGSNLAVMLKRDNPSWRIMVLDNLHRTGSILNVRRLVDSGVNFHHGDIRIETDIEAVGNFDILIECSAEPSVLAGYKNSPAYLNQTNLTGTIHCLDVCRKRGADILFLSTSRVYPIGVINGLKYREDEIRFTLASDQQVRGVSE